MKRKDIIHRLDGISQAIWDDQSIPLHDRATMRSAIAYATYLLSESEGAKRSMGVRYDVTIRDILTIAAEDELTALRLQELMRGSHE